LEGEGVEHREAIGVVQPRWKTLPRRTVTHARSV